MLSPNSLLFVASKLQQKLLSKALPYQARYETLKIFAFIYA